MLVYFTSGTTAFPKMVPRDYGYAAAHAITGDYWMDLKENDIHWTLSDTGWAKAAWGMLFPPWLVGASIVLYDGDLRFDADKHLLLIKKLSVTTFCAPPTVYRVFAQTDLSNYDLSSIRHSISAGEPLNPEVMRVWKNMTGTDVYDGYGQTETINIVANIPGMEVRPGSMGRPVPGLEVDIIDDKGKIVPDGDVGHIGVRLTKPYPPGLFRGYYDDEVANAECFHDGYYFSGDTATRDREGYIWFVGRSDDIISSASYRISPFEVESALQEHPAVAESAVIGKPDKIRGSIVKAYVILATGYKPSLELEKDIQNFVKQHTAPYKYPRSIEFRKSLPKTVSGKIRRVELREEIEADE
jgi:acetyl-CoA synthetase